MLRADAAWHVANAFERYLLHPWPGNVRELRAEALRFADLMRARDAAALTTPIPPIDELLADFAPAAPAAPAATGAVSPDDEADASTMRLDVAPLQLRAVDGRRAAAEALLADPDALASALSERADGRVKRLAAQLAPDLGRSAESARRAIDRALGDRLPSLGDEE